VSRPRTQADRDRDEQHADAHEGERRRTPRNHPAVPDDPESADTYTERRLVVPASDAKGRSERIWVRLQPSLIRACQMLVASKMYPWKTPGDFQRFAIYDTMRRLMRDAPPKVNSILLQLEAMKDILQHEEMQAEFVGVFERATRVIEVYRNAGANDEARRVIAELRAQINGMPDGYWKTRHRRDLGARFKDLMQGDAGGSFIELTEPPVDVVEQILHRRPVPDADEDSPHRAPHTGDDDDETSLDEGDLD
jgi:hypothetical protein